MKFKIKNNVLIKNLQKINRLLNKNTSFPILENVLIQIQDGILSLTTTNLEIELISNIKISTQYTPGSVTVSGRKLLDICKHSSDTADVKIQLNNNKIYVTSGSSSYILSTLPSNTFPSHHIFHNFSEFFISSHVLREMIEKTEFSMGKKDVRYYLNGMLLEKKGTLLSSVATDGYRLAKSQFLLKEDIIDFSVIIQRKGIIELYKLLNIPTESIRILIGKNNIRVHIQELIFTAQLIEGQYPDYNSVFLEKKNQPIICNCLLLKKSLLRASILSYDKFCGVEIRIRNGQFNVLSDNKEEETAEDAFSINYSGNEIEISINVYYVLDVLNVITSENVYLFVSEFKSSIQIEAENNSSTAYVIMLLKR